MKKKKATVYNLKIIPYIPFCLGLLFALGLQFVPVHTGTVKPALSLDVEVMVDHLGVAFPSLPSWQPDLGVGLVQATGGLTITKVANPMTPQAVDVGGLITYTLLITNHTGSDLKNVFITDTLPTHTQCEDMLQPANWLTNVDNCDQDPFLFWHSNTELLLDGESQSLEFQVRVDSPLADQTMIRNDAYRVSAMEDGGVTTFDDLGTLAAETTVDAPAWAISKTADPADVVEAGDFIDYVITFTNTGSLDPISTFTIIDTLPDNTTLSNNPDGATIDGSMLRWTRSDLAPNMTDMVRFSVQVDSPLPSATVINNQTYSIDGGGAAGPIAGAPVSVNVAASAHLIIDKVADVSTVFPAEDVTYTISYENIGNEVSSSYIISETIPENTTYVSSTPFTSFDGNRTYTWQSSNLSPVDGTQTLTITLMVDNGLANGTLLTNQVAISGTDGSFDTGTSLVTVDARPDLVLSKTIVPNQLSFQAGDTVTYTIGYTNVGRSTLTSVRITDTLPISLTVTAVDPGETIQVQANPPVFTLSNLATNQSGTITIVAKLADNPWPVAGFSFVNTVIGTSTQEEISQTNNTATVTSQGYPAEPHQITIEAPSQMPVGVDTVVTMHVFDPFGNRVSDDTLVTLSIGAPAVVSPQVVSTTQGKVQATVRADSAAANVQLSSTSGTASNSVNIDFLAADLVASMTASPNPVFPGGTIIYTIGVTNTGVFTAHDVVVTQTLDVNTSYISADKPLSQQIGQAYTFLIGSLAPGAGKTLTALAMANSTLGDGTPINSQADIDAATLPSIISLAESNTVTVPDLNTFATPNPVMAGEVVTYTIVYRNQSGGAISNLRITDTLPTQIETVESIIAGTATTVDNQLPTLVFSQDTVAAGEVVSITIAGRVVTSPWSTSLSPLINQVLASHSTQSSSDQISVTTQGQPNLPASLDLSQSKTILAINNSLIVTVTIRDQYDNLVLDNTPVVFTTDLVGGSIDTFGYTQQGVVTATLTTSISQTGQITVSTAMVSQMVSVTFAEPSLTVSLAGDPDNVSPGGTLVYALTVANTGLVDAEQVMATLMLDDGLSFASSSHALNQLSPPYVFDLGTIVAGLDQTVMVTATASASLTNDDTLTSSVTISADALPSSPSATATTPVSAVFLDVTVAPSFVQAGENVTYTLTYRNESGQMINTLHLTQTLPSEITQIVASDVGSAVLDSSALPTVTLTQYNIPAGQTTVMTLTGQVQTTPWAAQAIELPSTVTALANMADSGKVIRTANVDTMGGPNDLGFVSITTQSPITVAHSASFTITVMDQYNNPVLDGTTISISSSAGSTVVSPSTTSNGLITGTVTSNMAGTTVITAQVGDLSQTATIIVNDFNGQHFTYLPAILK
ncbi:MAG: hypothetical protein AAF629_04605 [Chloroflexota bacterium]